MKREPNRLVVVAIIVAELVSVGMMVGLTMTPASAQSASKERAQIKRQQQVILEQQRQILDNQRRLDGQREQFVSRSPVTGEAIDERKLPKGLLSGILPSCPLGFAYNPFTGCVLYVAH